MSVATRAGRVSRARAATRRAWAVVGLSVIAVSIVGAAAGVGAGTAVSWQPLPKAPIVGRIAASTVWTGKEMIVWGGVTPSTVRKSGPCDRCASDGAAYRWSTLEAGPSPLNSCGASAVTWTGTDLIVWSGTVYKPHNPTCAEGASIALGRASGTTITVGSKANGTTVRPRVGDTLVVRLPGNPTTGYKWIVARLPGPLRLVSTAYVPAAPGRLGQGGTYAFRFAVRAGSGAVRLEYRRPWEKQTPPLRSFTLTVRAR